MKLISLLTPLLASIITASNLPNTKSEVSSSPDGIGIPGGYKIFSGAHCAKGSLIIEGSQESSGSACQALKDGANSFHRAKDPNCRMVAFNDEYCGGEVLKDTGYGGYGCFDTPGMYGYEVICKT